MNILEKIIAQKRIELRRQKEAVTIDILEEIIRYASDKKSFKQALLQSSTGIIAEFKRRSPSKDWIFKEAGVDEVVPAYENAGASAISILTDEMFFGGSPADLKRASQLVHLPILRKDFVIDEYQLYQAKALGASVVLLIAAALTEKQCRQLAVTAHNIDLEVLLEIHTEAELKYITPMVDVVGINNRNLSTFVTDIQISLDLGEKIPADFVKISESGISSVESIHELRQHGFQGFLMGENFMKTHQPGEALKQFLEDFETHRHIGHIGAHIENN